MFRKLFTLFAALAVALGGLALAPQSAEASTAWTSWRTCNWSGAGNTGMTSQAAFLIETSGSNKRLRQMKFRDAAPVYVEEITSWESRGSTDHLKGAWNPYSFASPGGSAALDSGTAPVQNTDWLPAGGNVAHVILHEWIQPGGHCPVTANF